MKEQLDQIKDEVKDLLEGKQLGNLYSDDCIQETYHQFRKHFLNSYSLALFIVDAIISYNNLKQHAETAI